MECQRRAFLLSAGAAAITGCASTADLSSPLTIQERPSPNFSERERGVDTVVLHYTGMQSGPAALERLTDPDAGVSSHYLVFESGEIFRLVDEDKRAWHAGVAFWRGETDINARSIGIEIAHPGHEWGYRSFRRQQINAVIALLADINRRHAITTNRVLGHSDVAPGRKDDPGELFPWNRLADHGLAIGVYQGEPDRSITYAQALGYLRAIGYHAPEGAHAAAMLAFQRRFCPQELGQSVSPRTKAALRWAAGEMA